LAAPVGYVSSVTERAGIILAGGRSSRMGQPKASLDWHGVTLLEHTTALLRAYVDGPLIVMHAGDRLVPPLPGSVELLEDSISEGGPLCALATALAAVSGRAERAVVVPVDMPFVTPAFLGRLERRLGATDEMAIAVHSGRRHPLPAIVRTSVAEQAQSLVTSGRRALLDLAAVVNVATLDGDALRQADPTSRCLFNLNSEDDYRTALAASS
jgi:molybdenum cofactor guanylyltransferase